MYWCRSSGRLLRQTGGWSPWCAERTGFLFSHWRDGLAKREGRFVAAYKQLVGSGKGDEAKLGLEAHRGRIRGNGDELEDKTFHNWYESMFFTLRMVQHLFSWMNCRICVIGGTWNANWTRPPEEPALMGLRWAGGWPRDLQNSFSSCKVLWLYLCLIWRKTTNSIKKNPFLSIQMETFLVLWVVYCQLLYRSRRECSLLFCLGNAEFLAASHPKKQQTDRSLVSHQGLSDCFVYLFLLTSHWVACFLPLVCTVC